MITITVVYHATLRCTSGISAACKEALHYTPRTAASQHSLRKALLSDARDAGWKIAHNTAVCPACQRWAKRWAARDN